MQLRTAGLVTAVVAGTIGWVVVTPNHADVATQTARHTRRPTAGTGSAAINHASTSTRGVSAEAINVVFPVVALKQLAALEGFAGDVEFTEQKQAIHTFVDEINRRGGINGRKINAIVSDFDPTSETNMRALCKDWTRGSPKAFAVVDGVGAWTGDNQLCITQEGKTPFLGQWTTVSSWTEQGAPYLWWTGPDQSTIIATTVHWGLGAGLLGRGRKVGVIAGDRASDQQALKGDLLPALRRAGVTPTVATIAANPAETATTGTQAPLIIQQMRAAGVETVIPLIPFNVFFPVLQAETQQGYFPRLLLSDYESSIQVALGLIPVPYEKALDGQQGVTTETLGGIDDPRPEREGGYNPGVRSCYATYHKAYPQTPPGNMSPYIEEQGPIVGWCQAVRLFAAAATRAGRDLNRRTFVQAMASTKKFAGTYSPVLSFGPHRFSGPTEYRVVRLHNNDPKHNSCIRTFSGVPQGTCWQVVRQWRRLESG